jgi:hypothetical protein
MITRRFAHFICIFLLLFAQQSALTHSAWHAQEHSPAHQQDKGDASIQGTLCELHGVLSQVLSAVQAPEVRYACTPGVAEAIVFRAGARVVPELLVPLSRGPPPLS